MNPTLKITEKIKQNFDKDFSDRLPKILRQQRSVDGTIKLLLGLEDGIAIESVIMPFHKRHTVCLSSQAGCAMGCRFCRSGSRGLVRNLSALEILGQYMVCYEYICQQSSGRHIDKPNIVFMGEGEPLHNFDQVKKTCHMLLSRQGVYLGPRQITLSTVGHLPGLQRISELQGINIALSLHSAFPDKRKELIPVEQKWGLDEILPLLKEVPLASHQYINFEYLLIEGFNDSPEDADALSNIVKEFQAIVNIIPCNPAPGNPWQSPSEMSVANFKSMLVSRRVRTMVRISKGERYLSSGKHIINRSS